MQSVTFLPAQIAFPLFCPFRGPAGIRDLAVLQGRGLQLGFYFHSNSNVKETSGFPFLQTYKRNPTAGEKEEEAEAGGLGRRRERGGRCSSESSVRAACLPSRLLVNSPTSEKWPREAMSQENILTGFANADALAEWEEMQSWFDLTIAPSFIVIKSHHFLPPWWQG